MAMGTRRRRQRQERLWISHQELAKGPGHPFYKRVNELLETERFDEFAEKECARFYAENNGRPSLTPGIYFRLLLVGYFEGIDSERGIAWRAADSFGLRQFLGIAIDESTPDHSTISRTRRLIDVETHRKVFFWVLERLRDQGGVKGKTVGIDATTLEANAAMRSIVRRDNGESYEDFLKGLAKESGIATPTREDLARFDRTRKNKASNQDWVNPHDRNARITKMKDGRTHLAHKAEHAVDLKTGAVLAVTLQEADQGDTTTVLETLVQAGENVAELIGTEGPEQKPQMHLKGIEEVVTDKGYHSGAVLVDMKSVEVRTYMPEKRQTGQRHWEGKYEEQQAVYANRRRVNGAYGKRLLRKRGELIERSFAHCYDTGGMRRTHLRGQQNILKRLLIHVGAFNLSLIFRSLLGSGTPRELRNRQSRLIFVFSFLFHHFSAPVCRTHFSFSSSRLRRPRSHRISDINSATQKSRVAPRAARRQPRGHEWSSQVLLLNLLQLSPIARIHAQIGADLLTGNQPILSGDMMDVELLSVAVPVSHFVLTDKKMADRIKCLGIDKEWKTEVFSMSEVDGLFERLEALR
jgi:transposase